ncbi:MAG: energy-coupling factor ABC transporter ATP-binding protein [Kiritimatiellae bacterium]|nr:energy-coupling factor ABC transporter ATP-binding protein [Kiritimatiellia bacterium]MDW8459293.1 ABC transporter ATP-binding protein [Verrucomicrobiota bacterium]
MSGPILELAGIEFAHPFGRPLFRGFSLALSEGERIGLTGPNGSGKSTLLHLAMGLLRPQAGEIRHRGFLCKTETDFLALRREVGLVFQNPDDQLFCATVDEDVAFGPFNLGWPRDRVERAVVDTLERLGIRHLAGRITYRLSEGEKRLVALATVLVMEPRALLLDEPTAGLDEHARDRLVRELAASHLPMIIASHDEDLLARLATRRVDLGAAPR